MISEKMSKLLERSAAMSSMYTESARLKEKYGAENVYDFGMGNPNPACARQYSGNEYPRFAGNRPLVSASLYAE